MPKFKVTACLMAQIDGLLEELPSMKVIGPAVAWDHDAVVAHLIDAIASLPVPEQWAILERAIDRHGAVLVAPAIDVWFATHKEYAIWLRD